MTHIFINRFIPAIMFMLTVSGMNKTFANTRLAAASHALYAEITTANQADLPSEEVFALAYKGYNALKKDAGLLKKDVITVIDFSLPSTEKRLWIIDLATRKVLVNDYVAHGRNSGDNEAVSFSNTTGSNKSSIGFYLTGETYRGKHGLSLRLEGLDEAYNSNARSRAIVMHGADYVSARFIKKYGRLGR